MRPRSIAVSHDGLTVYVTDACEDSPEKIWMFTRTQNLRERRTLLKGQGHRYFSTSIKPSVQRPSALRTSVLRPSTNVIRRNPNSAILESIYWQLAASNRRHMNKLKGALG